MQKLFLTFFYSGSVKKASGTFGTIAALIPAFLYLNISGLILCFY